MIQNCSGHTHVPFIGKAANKIIFNVGSIGTPLDGVNRPSYGIIKIKNKISNATNLTNVSGITSLNINKDFDESATSRKEDITVKIRQ